jgi:hypothetical protein
MARRPHTASVHRHLLLSRLIITLGGSAVAAYFRSQSLLD